MRLMPSMRRNAKRLLILLLVLAHYIPPGFAFTRGADGLSVVLCTVDGARTVRLDAQGDPVDAPAPPALPERCAACLTSCASSAGLLPLTPAAVSARPSLHLARLPRPRPAPAIRRICPPQPSRAPPFFLV
ncbi:MAG: DUF2946 family protein [Alphaproteobacteria bacterium]